MSKGVLFTRSCMYAGRLGHSLLKKKKEKKKWMMQKQNCLFFALPRREENSKLLSRASSDLLGPACSTWQATWVQNWALAQDCTSVQYRRAQLQCHYWLYFGDTTASISLNWHVYVNTNIFRYWGLLYMFCTWFVSRPLCKKLAFPHHPPFWINNPFG